MGGVVAVGLRLVAESAAQSDDEEYTANASDAMRSLLDTDLFFGTSKPGHMVDMKKFRRVALMSKL